MEREGVKGFDWALFEKGPNSSFPVQQGVKVYSHAAYAKDAYEAYMSGHMQGPKDYSKTGCVYTITDIKVVNDHEILATINGGASDILIDINKETKYLSMFSSPDGEVMTKEMFMQNINVPEFKKTFLEIGVPVQVSKGAKSEKASMWDGHNFSLVKEMKEQITKTSKAYMATIVGHNNGGFFVEVMGSVKAFMPFSLTSNSRINDIEEYIGKTMEVMVENWSEQYGFVVSHKKYTKFIYPQKLAELKAAFEKDPEKTYVGKVTGTPKFGVFLEICDMFSCLLHKTLISDELRERWKSGGVEFGEEIQVWIHNIDGNRIILSDVPSAEREAVIAIREKQDEEEKEALKSPAEKARDAEALKKKREAYSAKKEEELKNKLEDLQNMFNKS